MTLVFTKGQRILDLPGQRKSVPEASREMPPAVRQVTTVLEAIKCGAKEIGHGRSPLATKEVADARYEICKTCELFTDARCVSCGCFLKFKTKLALEKCPENKWPTAEAESK